VPSRAETAGTAGIPSGAAGPLGPQAVAETICGLAAFPRNRPEVRFAIHGGGLHASGRANTAGVAVRDAISWVRWTPVLRLRRERSRFEERRWRRG